MPKSCLKNSPPRSREPSPPPSPTGGSWCSPRMRPHPLKTVSFCDDEALEEVFIVDEWDRTPAPVTPRLTYQDMLELKALRLTPPRTPPAASYRQPFTTSLPGPYADGFPFPHSQPHPQSQGQGGSAPFPVSRFAAQPSHTPSKWKNRGQVHLDPEILPYLEAVPIRLLPLLDNPEEDYPSPPPDESRQEPTPTSEHAASPAVEPPNPSWLSPETLPATPTHPSPESLLTPPTPRPSPPHPPALQIPLPPAEPPTPTPPPASAEDSPTTPTTLLPPRRAFTFVPLLPVAPAPAAPVPAPAQRPKRTFNMSFVQLAAPVEPAPAPALSSAPSTLPPAPIEAAPAPAPQLTSPTDSAAPTPSLSPSSPSPPADDPDPELEHEPPSSDADTDLDTDAESDAPSSSPSTSTAESQSTPASPPELPGARAAPFPALAPAHADGYFGLLPDAALGASGGGGGGGEGTEKDAGPGLTPPLSALYPSPRGQTTAPGQTQALRGVPSAALAPPSPFVLGPAVMSKRAWARKVFPDAPAASGGVGSGRGVDGEGVLPPSIGRRRGEGVVA